MNVGKLILSLIILFTVLTVISFFYLPPKYSLSLAIIDVAVIIFSFLVWLNDRHFHHQMSQRVFSINDKGFIHDVITRQMNMHGVNKVVETDKKIEFFKGKNKVGEVVFRTDENGNILKIDGKYIIEINAPEYILHNIDHETWSLIGKR
jgi:hypothetical protein